MFSSIRRNYFINILPSLALAYQLFLYFQVSIATSSITIGSIASTLNINYPRGVSKISSAGDLNGDGLEDIIISLMSYHQYTYSGTVYTIFGPETNTIDIDLYNIDSSEGIEIIGSSDDWLSSSVSSLGDINNDGVDDIILGAANTARTYVIFGNAVPSNINIYATSLSSFPRGLRITGSSRLGERTSSAGDFNGDGFNDFMITASGANQGKGIVYIIFGKTTFSSSNINLNSGLTSADGIQIMGGVGDSAFGNSLSKAGDVNKDGIDDILIGTDQSSCPSSTGVCGKVVVIYGTKTPVSPIQIDSLDVSQGIRIIGGNGAAIGSFGSISSAGDINNDGVDDIVIGAPGFSPTSATAGAGQTFVIYGKNGGFTDDIGLSNPFDGFKITGNIAGGAFGKSIISGDINNDGLSDLIVGSDDINAPSIIHIVFGNKYGLYDMDLSKPDYQLPQVLKITGDGTAYLNNGLTLAKDFNQDGVNDILIASAQNVSLLYGSECEETTQCSSSSIPSICYVSKGCVCGEFGQSFHKNKCVSQCPDGYYSSEGFCKSCPTTCATCTSVSNCQTCSEGYKLQGNLCEFACPTGYHLVESTCQSDNVSRLEEIQNIQSVTNVTDPVTSATLAVAEVVAFSDPGSAAAGILALMFQNIKYLNVSYSQRLELTFKYHNSTYGPYKVGPRMPLDLISNLPLHAIPARFLKFHVHSSFLINFWDNLIFLAILFGLLSLVAFIEWGVTKIKKKTVSSLRMGRAAIQCFSMMQFYNVLGDILLFAVLETQTKDLVNSETNLSFSLSILFLCIGSLILGAHLYILIRFSKFRKNPLWPSEIEEFSKKYEGSSVIFKHFKDSAFASQSFLFFFVMRSCIFNLTLAFLPDQPEIQISLILTFSAIMLMYLIAQRPFKTIVNLLQHITCEILLLIVNISVLMITHLKFENQGAYENRDQLCDVIIYTTLVFGYVPQVFLVIKVIVAVIEWRMSKKKSSQKQVKTDRNVKIQKRAHNGTPKFITYQNRGLNDSSVEISMAHNISGLSHYHNNSLIIEYPDKGSSPLHQRERMSNSRKVRSSPRRQQLDDLSLSLKQTRDRDHSQFHQQQSNIMKPGPSRDIVGAIEDVKQTQSPRFRSVVESNARKKILFNKKNL